MYTEKHPPARRRAKLWLATLSLLLLVLTGATQTRAQDSAVRVVGLGSEDLPGPAVHPPPAQMVGR